MSNIIGIRREDKNEWERRVPIIPAQVKELVKEGIEIWIQPSQIRIFKDEEYTEAGAKVIEDLSGCDIVFGVKEFPIPFFHEGQTAMFFSHTIKGQKYNMSMLQAILDMKCTLFDYEKVTDDKNLRLIFFGNYAGLAGMIETLYTYGKRMEWEGVNTPFLGLKRPLDYNSLDEARAVLEAVGTWIKCQGLPESIGPVVIGFAGYGNVSRGAQEILDILPVEEIQPGELASFIEKGEYSRFKVYKVVFYEKDMVEPVDPACTFELQDYFQHPEKYKGTFAQYNAHLSMLVNCIYWTPDYPMLVTKDWIKKNWTMDSKLKVLGDITCDIEGSVECTLEATEPGTPSYVYLPETDEMKYGWEGEGPVVMSVDTLPSELPRESSTFFGTQLMPFVKMLANADLKADLENLQLPGELMRALIAYHGKLTPNFEYIQEFLK
ncbi:MAG: hypothetical protein KAS67_05150 [Thermoplasmata archaeon]|nr:hypothetical protein [Thermoplasmata archaeon]